LYVQDPYINVNWESLEYLKSKIKYLYVTTIVGSGKNRKLVFTPFVGSKYCCLEENTEYFYFSNDLMRSSKSPDILNKKKLESLYI
jgi:hypothetical protein